MLLIVGGIGGSVSLGECVCVNVQCWRVCIERGMLGLELDREQGGVARVRSRSMRDVSAALQGMVSSSITGN